LTVPRQPGQFLVGIAESPIDLEAVRVLWREYWESIGLPDEFQGFGEELKGLPGAYGADGGALLIASMEAQPAGTIALRRLNDRSGEIKRLYLRPDFRGRGLGRQLLERVIERARAIGYEALYADTLPSMADALSLYARLGFERIEAYAGNPTPGAVYLRLDLMKLQLR
jgi:GNAT superfamily N-acetyltransferase